MRSTKDLRLIVGTIVRVPNDIEEDETIGGNFRDFRLGTLLSLNQELSSAQVQLVHLELGTQYIENRELPIEYLNRCELPEDIPFIHCQSKEKGTILCIHKMQDGFQFYFVRLLCFYNQLFLMPLDVLQFEVVDIFHLLQLVKQLHP